MFVEDLKNDFYNVLLGKRVLLLVHYDVDAICACRILQGLFKCDNISYTLVPVGGISELKKAYEENSEEVKYVVLLNCGGTIDLVDILQPDEDVVFFVLDSHKPTDVCNVYSDGQIRLVFKDNEEDIPNFEEIFRDDDEEEEPDTVESGREALEAAVERRRARRQWEDRRDTLMNNYTQYSYYGKPSACVLVELSWKMSRCEVSALWSACVSTASQAALKLRTDEKTVLDHGQLHTYISTAQTTTQQSSKVVLEKDVCLPLYRMWTLEDALRNAPDLAPFLKLHTVAGSARIRQILADMGFPLQQARQSFRSMDVELRRSLLEMLETAVAKHKLPAISHATFTLYRVHSPPLAATDLVYIILGLIEHPSIPPSEGFQLSLSSLSVSSGECASRAKGASQAQRALTSVSRLITSAISAKDVHVAGPFIYIIFHEGVPELSNVRGSWWSSSLGRWAGDAGGGRPVVVSVPAQGRDLCLLRGVPPGYRNDPHNLFGAAFEQAASRSGVTITLDHFDTSLVTLPVAQRTNFLDALTALMS